MQLQRWLHPGQNLGVAASGFQNHVKLAERQVDRDFEGPGHCGGAAVRSRFHPTNHRRLYLRLPKAALGIGIDQNTDTVYYYIILYSDAELNDLMNF